MDRQPQTIEEIQALLAAQNQGAAPDVSAAPGETELASIRVEQERERLRKMKADADKADEEAEAEHERMKQSHRRRTFVKSGPLNWSTNAADKLSICGNSFPLYLTAPFGRFHNPPDAWRSS